MRWAAGPIRHGFIYPDAATPVLRYAARLVGQSNPDARGATPLVKRAVRFGAGVRGAQSLILAAKAVALIEGRGHVSFGDVQRTARPDPQDTKGPLSVAVVATKDKARLVVYGTSNLAANQFLNLQGNRDFFLNTVSWLAEEEDQITVRPKDSRQNPIFLSARQGQLVFWLPVVVLPGLVLAGGVIAVIRRRAAK